MLLRASGDIDATFYSLPDAIHGVEGGGVPEGPGLVAYTNAVLRRDVPEIEVTRSRLLVALGAEAVVDTAAVISVFTMLNRVANSTGLPLDGLVDSATGELTTELGLDRYRSAGEGRLRSWPWTWLRAIVSPLMGIPALYRLRRLYWWLIRNG